MKSLMSVDRHPDAEEIESYSMGAISDAETGGLEEHLLICEQCRNRVLEADAYLSAMRQAGTEIRGALKQRSFWSWTLAAASSMAVIVAAVFLLRSPLDMRVQEARLYAMRGATSGVKVSAQRPLRLVPDLTGLPEFRSYRVQIVDGVGKPIYTGLFSTEDPAVKMNGVPSGIYFVRLFSPNGKLLREYGLESSR